MSDPTQSPESASDTTSNPLNGDLEKLNSLAEDVKARLRGGFGDYYEDGSRGDMRPLQRPKLLQLVEKVDEVNANLRKLEHCQTFANSSEMTDADGVGSMSGGKATATQMQAVFERLEKLTEKNTELEQKVSDAVVVARGALKHSEATDLENESLRKDVARLESKLEEVGRKAALPAPEHSRLNQKVEGLRGQMQAASSKAQEIAKRFEALQMQIGQASSTADTAAEKAETVRAAANNATESRDTYRTEQDRAILSLEPKCDRIITQIQDVEGKARSASSKADSAFSTADAASNKAAKADTLASSTCAKVDTHRPNQEESVQELQVRCAGISDSFKDLRGKVEVASGKAQSASTQADAASTKADMALDRATSASITANAVSLALKTHIAEQEEAVRSLEAQCAEFSIRIWSMQQHQHSNDGTVASLRTQLDTMTDRVASAGGNRGIPKHNNSHGILVSNFPPDTTQTTLIDWFQETAGPVVSCQVLQSENPEKFTAVVHFRNARGAAEALKRKGMKIDGQPIGIEALTKPLGPREVFAQRW